MKEIYKILNRFSGEVKTEVEIECAPDALPSVKLSLAVRAVLAKAKEASYYGRANLSDANLSRANLSDANLSDANLSRANLSDADLSDANLSRANLSDANLSRANLSDANLSDANLSDADLSDANLSDADLSDANLSDADLRPFKADFFLTLSSLRCGPLEALHLIEKLKAGKINGATYCGDSNGCACLVGTIADARKANVGTLDQGASRPAERWFMMINPGDSPISETKGSFAAKMALEWAEDWCACHGVETPIEPVSA